MGILNDLWWLSGIALAAPVAIIGVEYLGRSDPVMGIFFLLVAAIVLLLPEYIKRRLFGSATSGLASVPVVGKRFRDDE